MKKSKGIEESLKMKTLRLKKKQVEKKDQVLKEFSVHLSRCVIKNVLMVVG